MKCDRNKKEIKLLYIQIKQNPYPYKMALIKLREIHIKH